VNRGVAMYPSHPRVNPLKSKRQHAGSSHVTSDMSARAARYAVACRRLPGGVRGSLPRRLVRLPVGSRVALFASTTTLVADRDMTTMASEVDAALEGVARGGGGKGVDLYGMIDTCLSFAFDTNLLKYAVGAEELLRGVRVRDAAQDALCADSIVVALMDLQRVDVAVRIARGPPHTHATCIRIAVARTRARTATHRITHTRPHTPRCTRDDIVEWCALRSRVVVHHARSSPLIACMSTCAPGTCQRGALCSCS
jgi:hypothetical protein